MKSLLSVLIRLAVGGIFVYSGWHKLMAPTENFMAALEGYQFLSSSLIPAAAFLFPWIEFIIGSFLLLGFMTRASAAVLGAFLAVFIVLLARSLWLHLPIHECGCFGSGITLSPKQAIALDGTLLLSVLVLVSKGKFLEFSFDGWIHKGERHIKRV